VPSTGNQSQVLPLSTGLPCKVLPLSTKLEVFQRSTCEAPCPCRSLTNNCPQVPGRKDCLAAMPAWGAAVAAVCLHLRLPPTLTLGLCPCCSFVPDAAGLGVEPKRTREYMRKPPRDTVYPTNCRGVTFSPCSATPTITNPTFLMQPTTLKVMLLVN
jgi:hypothetical protein